jgi:hypothetical protein
VPAHATGQVAEGCVAATVSRRHRHSWVSYLRGNDGERTSARVDISKSGTRRTEKMDSDAQRAMRRACGWRRTRDGVACAHAACTHRSIAQTSLVSRVPIWIFASHSHALSFALALCARLLAFTRCAPRLSRRRAPFDVTIEDTVKHRVVRHLIA